MAKLNPNISRRGFVRLALAGAGALALSQGATPAEAEQAAAAAAGTYPNEFTVAILSDIHYMSHRLFSECDDFVKAENSDRKMFRQSADILTKALEDVKAYQPDAIFVSGDLTKDGEHVCHDEVHTMLRDTASAIKDATNKDVKVRVINGNHDINNNIDSKDFSSGVAVDDNDLVKSLNPAAFREMWNDCGYSDAEMKYIDAGQGGIDGQGGSVSYVTRFVAPDNQSAITMICVDSCRYSADMTDFGTDEHETHGRITGVPDAYDPSVEPTGLLKWVCDQADAAKKRGDVVIAMQHHGIVPHFGQEPTILSDYLVENYDTVAAYYAAHGITCVLTGHMHANDVSAHNFPNIEGSPTIYDIETCATVTYPSDIRYLKIKYGPDEQLNGQTGAILDFASHKLGAIKYTLKNTDGTPAKIDYYDDRTMDSIDDITAFGKDHLIKEDLLTNVMAVYGGQAIDYIEADPAKGPYYIESLKIAGGGIKPSLGTLMGFMLGQEVPGDQVNQFLFTYLTDALTKAGYTSAATGLQYNLPSSVPSQLGKSVSIWYDANAAKITIRNRAEAASTEKASELVVSEEQAQAVQEAATTALAQGGVMAAADTTIYFTMTIGATGDKSLNAFLDKMFKSIDDTLVPNKEKIVACVQRILIDACEAKLVSDPDEQLLAAINYAYGCHLFGDEKREGWAQTAFDDMAHKTGTDPNDPTVNVKNDGSLIGYVRTAIDGYAADDPNKPDKDTGAGQGKAADILELLANVQTDLTSLVEVSFDNGFIGLIGGPIVNAFLGGYKTLADLVNSFTKDKTLGLVIPDIPALTNFVMPILYTMTDDPNLSQGGAEASTSTNPDGTLADSKQGDHFFAFQRGGQPFEQKVTIAGNGVVDGKVTLKPGDTLTLTATYTKTAVMALSEYNGPWSTSDAKVASVDEQGTDDGTGTLTTTVTAVAAGDAVISAMYNGVTGTIAVHVEAASKPTGVAPDILNVDFRRRSAKDWVSGHTLNRSHYSGGTRMDKKLRQPVAMMDGKGGLGYDLTADDYKKMIDNGFTMELLFRVPSTPDGYHSLFDNVQNDGMGLYLDGSTLTFEVKEGTSSSKTVTVADIQPSTWYHVVAVNDNVSSAPSMSITLNGGDKTTTPDAQAVGSQETSYTIYVGAETSMNNGAPENPAVRNTAIAFARIYGKPLTDDEAAQLYQKSGLAGK